MGGSARAVNRRQGRNLSGRGTLAKNLLKGELKRRGGTYEQLAKKLEAVGVVESERNLCNKISRGGFSAAFLLQCLAAIGASSLHLD